MLHRALAAARIAGRESLTAGILRELGFVDVQAGRHASAARALADAAAAASAAGDPGLTAGVLAIRGMNEADQGRHDEAVRLLDASAQLAAERSIRICDSDRWNAFLPWPQALRAHCLLAAGQWPQAREDAEQAYALACQLGDPCWEGMAGRALALLALHAGDSNAAGGWIADARQRCDRLPDRYVWVSGFVALGQLEIAASLQPRNVLPLARRLYREAVQADLPEFIAWALVYQAEAGDRANLPLARTLASQVTSPGLQARAAALG